MSSKQQRLQTALDAIHAREAAKRPEPVEPVKPKRKNVTVDVTAAPVEAEYVVESREVVNELDAIGEGDQ